MEQRQQKRRSDEWRVVFTDWRKSGESQRGYCGREGISISAFGYWYRKLNSGNEEHQLVKIGGLTAQPTVGENGLTARAGGVLVELTGRESEDFLTSVFRALKAIS